MIDDRTSAPRRHAIDPARLYAALLVVFALANIAALWVMFAVMSLPPGARAPSPSRLPDWVLPWNALLSAAYLAIIGAALALHLVSRHLNGTVARWLRRLNYALLVAFPFGTAIGAYWLLKVARPPGPLASNEGEGERVRSER